MWPIQTDFILCQIPDRDFILCHIPDRHGFFKFTNSSNFGQDLFKLESYWSVDARRISVVSWNKCNDKALHAL